jgi:hypothetical protein
MKQILLIAALLISFPFLETSSAQQNSSPQNSQVTIRDAYDTEALEVDEDPAASFDSTIISPTCTDCPINTLRATRVDCVNVGDEVWVISDGTTAVDETGLPIAANQSFTIYGFTNIDNFSAISGAGDSSVLYCQFSRVP